MNVNAYNITYILCSLKPVEFAILYLYFGLEDYLNLNLSINIGIYYIF